MNKVYLSDSGPKVSEAVYGFWRWTNNGEQTINQMEKIVNLCLELGVNTFDHADIYGNSSIEEYFGKLIKNKGVKREDIVLFSKCGVRKSTKGYTYFDNSEKYILESVDNSLKRLGTDYLDIFLLNQLDMISNPEETAQTLRELVNIGKIKHIGVSNFSVFQHQLLESYLRKPIVTNHIELNLANTSAIEDGRLDFIKQRFSKPLAWAPLAGGKILDGTDFKSAILKEKLAEVGQKYGANIEQTAVAWLIQLGTLPIIGSLSEQRIRNAVSATEIKLNHEDWYEIYNVALMK
ncbi:MULTISPECIES: aldo/keto reductase [Flectobacillus]|jgi:predicted oxidoreductase|uniref:Aldo/keto reductase n=1 Tax=Flectobacillus roseus TaxID=502259 RepID=A0ABT6Y7A6_9BACT|nr:MULTISPECIES: aldo/keto reductase [Flectobacillus]MDI9859460.1 aldo/keto reductase [Flectobacillus roseus]MDI9871523.1 aldo/keto reductase [Flectobacillus roseus]NBA75713.1 aldo/keto reductase [Emticicia sp. ODNR4P]PAC29770.1 aldo/keto reductase [Flectobacillus sp. BAB-3569]